MPTRTSLAAARARARGRRHPVPRRAAHRSCGRTQEVRDLLPVLARRSTTPADEVAVVAALRAPAFALRRRRPARPTGRRAAAGTSTRRTPAALAPEHPVVAGHRPRCDGCTTQRWWAGVVGHGRAGACASCASSSWRSPIAGPATTGGGCASCSTRPAPSRPAGPVAARVRRLGRPQADESARVTRLAGTRARRRCRAHPHRARGEGPRVPRSSSSPGSTGRRWRCRTGAGALGRAPARGQDHAEVQDLGLRRPPRL